MVSTLFYFIFALLLLILIHEFGHFIVARSVGVKVLRFSFGFGKVLASFYDKRGTQYAWSIFPLGGYVKMLDETEEEVPASMRHLAFNNQPMWAKFAIVLAGPLFNFLFAFVALWLVLVIGMQSLAPIIDKVNPDSFAAKAGFSANQEIIALDRKKITSWRDFQYALIPVLGGDGKVAITLRSLKTHEEKTHYLPLQDWPLNAKNADVFSVLGIEPFVPKISTSIGQVVPDSPADKAGLKADDTLLALNGKKIEDWFALVEAVKGKPNQTVTFLLLRQGKKKVISVPIKSQIVDGKMQGQLGVLSKKPDLPPHWLRLQREAPIPALGIAFQQTVHLTTATFTLIGRLVTGKLPLTSLSGPVGIAQGAGESGRSGIAYYLSFLALISISLGVLNLLPIPMLDGGHLFYYLIEIVRRRPLSQEVKSVGAYVGLLLLIVLTAIAMSNDLGRLS